MDSKKVDLLNIGLILLSLILAFFFPLRLFLYAYAIIGPLHYLTQINWTSKHNYFISEKKWIWIAIGLTILAVLPKYIVQPIFESLYTNTSIKTVTNWFLKWSNSFIFMGIAFTFCFLYIKKKSHQVIFLLLCILTAIIFNSLPLYIVIFGLLIPTVLHVYCFTILFMLKGAIKNSSKYGYASVAMMIGIPLLIFLVEINPKSYFFPKYLKAVFTETQFHITNTNFAEFLGLSDGKSFFFYEKIELKIMIFMAFIYTYHYLNWFSKTTIIGWHKNLTQKRSITILIVWASMLGLFFYDYKLGFFVSLLLSLLHVILEFPLNIKSLEYIGSEVRSFFQKNLLP